MINSTTIAGMTSHPVRAHPSSDSIRCFEKQKGNPFLMKLQRTAKTRKSAPYDTHIGSGSHSILLSRWAPHPIQGRSSGPTAFPLDKSS